jgi:hypothetical protein
MNGVVLRGERRLSYDSHKSTTKIARPITPFVKEQAELTMLAERVGFLPSLRNLTSSIAFEFALIADKKRGKPHLESWLSIAAILESRGK